MTTTAGHLILVGLPGAGKSTVGPALAARLARPFLDFDLEIERREGRTIAQLFAERGEAHFRAAERRLTEELRGAEPMILAPGGGWIANQGLVELLRPPGTIVYLRARPEVVLARMGERRSERPLLSDRDPLGAIRRLLAQRGAAYEAADVVLDTDLLDVQRVTDEIIRLVRPGGTGYVIH